jgi:hypothetical protein
MTADASTWCVVDAATYDLGDDVRIGTRSVSVGEKPYFDPQSKSRREDLDSRNKV